MKKCENCSYKNSCDKSICVHEARLFDVSFDEIKKYKSCKTCKHYGKPSCKGCSTLKFAGPIFENYKSVFNK